MTGQIAVEVGAKNCFEKIAKIRVTTQDQKRQNSSNFLHPKKPILVKWVKILVKW